MIPRPAVEERSRASNILTQSGSAIVRKQISSFHTQCISPPAITELAVASLSLEQAVADRICSTCSPCAPDSGVLPIRSGG